MALGPGARPRLKVKTVQNIGYRAGPATRLDDGKEGVKVQYQLSRVLHKSIILLSNEREGGSGRTGPQSGTIASYVDIGLDHMGCEEPAGVSQCLLVSDFLVNVPIVRGSDSESSVEGQHYLRDLSALIRSWAHSCPMPR